MKSIKNMSKAAKIFITLFGIAIIFSSCSKEEDCKCYDSDGDYAVTVTIDKGKCEDVTLTDISGNYTCE